MSRTFSMGSGEPCFVSPCISPHLYFQAAPSRTTKTSLKSPATISLEAANEAETSTIEQVTEDFIYPCISPHLYSQRGTFSGLGTGSTPLESHLMTHPSTLLAAEPGYAWPEAGDILPASGRVPNELWHKILSYACVDTRTYRLTTSYRLKSKVYAPALHCSHVCSRWKAIVLSHPEFWDSININVCNLSPKAIPLISHYLVNSEPRPLCVRIYDSRWAEGTVKSPGSLHVQEAGSAAFELIMKHSRRLWHLSLDIDSASTFTTLTKKERLKVSFRNLLSFSTTMGTANIKPYFMVDFWYALYRKSPKLKILTTNLTLPVLYPYAQLNTLVVQDPWSIYRLVRVLSRCEKLVTLKIHGYTHDGNADDTSPASNPVSLPFLRNLSLHCDDLPSSLLSAFSIPHLINLEMSSKSKRTFTPNQSNDPSLDRLGMALRWSSLETLSLDFPNLRVPDTWLLELLPHVPKLGHLAISTKGCRDHESGVRTMITKNLFSRLIIDLNRHSSGEILAPNLTSLSICERNFVPTAGCDGAIVKMLCSRSKSRLLGMGIRPLGRLSLEFGSTKKMTIVQHLLASALIEDVQRAVGILSLTRESIWKVTCQRSQEQDLSEIDCSGRKSDCFIELSVQ